MDNSLEIACPECGTHLRIPDRSLLGKKGKCKKCGNRFIMTEPEPAPVQFQVASTPANLDQTMVGEFVKWVPEGGLPEFAPAAPPPPVFPTPAPAPVFAPPPQAPVAAAPIVTDPLPSPLNRVKRRKGGGLLIGGLVVVVLALGAVALYLAGVGQTPKKAGKKSSASASRMGEDETGKAAAAKSVAKKTAAEDEERAQLDLTLLPEGVEILVHMRPAQLWADTPYAKELRAALGPLEKWLNDEKEGVFRKQCFQDPKNIEEVVFGFVPETYPTPPSLCWVVRTTKAVKQSDLIDAFSGPAEQQGPREVYVNEALGRAYMIKDNKTYASCPASMKTSMVENMDRPARMRDELIPILAASDRNRPLNVIAVQDTLLQHKETVVPTEVQPAMTHFLDWCSTDTRAFGLSLQLDEEQLDSEILLAVDRIRSPKKVRAYLEESLQKAPQDVLQMVLKTHPDTVGRRKLVGRFPAMVKAYAMSTEVKEPKGNVIALRTFLPTKAAPNLAAAGLITWSLTNRPDFGSAQPESTGPTTTEKPMTIAERLQKKIPEIDFRTEFMYACFDFIGQEIGVKFKLEGDDLKMAGVTQNMKQTFKMDNAPATDAINKIVEPLKLCIVVDEENNLVHVTSLKAAEERKWKPFPLK